MNRQLLAVSATLLPEWLPGGRFQGHEYVCASLDGGAGESLSVNATTGKWGDFATTDLRGGDLISLYAMIHGLSQGEALKALSGSDYKPSLNGAHRGTPRESLEQEAVETHTPPNVSFEASLFRHHALGTPSHFWVYRDATTTPMHVVARYPTSDGGKAVLPWVFDGLKWVNRGPKSPRPLYGLDRLASIDGRVLLVEGEKTADAAQYLFPKRPCLSWMGGVGQVGSADLSPLAGRGVTIWPDNDEPGRNAAARIAAMMFKLGCDVTIIDPSEFPEKWDLADGLAAGTPAAQLREYAKTHTRAVEKPEPKPAPHPLERVQTGAQGEVIENRPRPGSMVEAWQRYGFDCKANGRPYCSYTNVSAAILAHGDLDIFYDEFSHRVMVGNEPWTSHQTRRLAMWLQKSMGMSEVTVKTVDEGVMGHAFARRRNPLIQWLDGLVWDGQDRIRDLMPVGFGSVRTEYTQEVGRCFMIAMAARGLKPGCKHDVMPVFEGGEGMRKSSALKALGDPYFIELHERIDNKDFYIALQGKLLAEISEMQSLERAGIKKVKGIISTQVDTYRAPYDRVAADRPRVCVFAGTSNRDDWNTDDTGARRFWPLRCGKVDVEWIRENRDQLFAEAVARYRQGEDWWKVPEASANRQREARMRLDPWHDLIASYCEPREHVTIHGILINAIERKKDDAKPDDMVRIAAVLRQLGWVNTVKWVGGKAVRQWVRKPADSP